MKTPFLILIGIILALAPVQAKDDTSKAHQTQWAQQSIKPQPLKGDQRRGVLDKGDQRRGVLDGLIQVLKLIGIG